MKYPWGTERRLNTYSDYFKAKFGGRIQKITINAGFTCPNRDGTCGTGGCTFCDNRAFNPSYNEAGKSVEAQLLEGMKFHKTRYRRVNKYLAYFQAYSNTHADMETLRAIYEQALEIPDIVGIVVGTRPDCVDAEKLDYFKELSRQTYLVIEYGIESLLTKTLERVNRGHDAELTKWAIEETAGRGIRTGGHMMIGLPGEERQDFLDMAEVLSHWPLNSIKFHQLQIIRGTAMEAEYRENPDEFLEFSMEEYLQLMMEILERLNPSMVVERIAGEVNPAMAAREGWGVRYDEVLRKFEALLEKHNTWQGRKYTKAL